MNAEAMLVINDIDRMSESLIKLISATNENYDIPHDHALMLKGIVEIREGVDKVVKALTKT